MDAIVIGRVREFLDVYRSGNLEEALKKLKELEDFVERLLNVTRDAKALALALNVYLAIPLYEDMIKLRMKIEKA